jgi:hypothetical protein
MTPGKRLDNDANFRESAQAGVARGGLLVSQLLRLAKRTNRALGVLFQDRSTDDRNISQPAVAALDEPPDSRLLRRALAAGPRDMTPVLGPPTGDSDPRSGSASGSRRLAVASPSWQADKPTYLVIALSALAHSWPAEVREEIAEFGLEQARLSLPAGVVRRALKQGHLAFSWRLLRSSLKPTPPARVSRHDAKQLELPINTIASLSYALECKSKLSKAQLGRDSTEFGLGVDDTLALDSQSVEPPSKPAEIVTRAMAYKGVDGAMILLPDGWIVASRLPQSVNGEALAAFLPQIVDKLDECGEELGMGQLTRLNFALGGTPWNVFRLKELIFAAFGSPGAPLPGARLTALAGELEN